ncbi:DIP1984 family protein [Herpetosiphon gulosus]|uniref:Septicolysin n=1 Tax=Herpetosiphon gulosus TaxID=1973496 RepID=A0ABP9WYB1_9CHLR
MKLAEALILRADIQRRLEQLRTRVKLSVLIQEGDDPPEDPHELLSEIERLLLQFEDMIVKINHTNSITPFNDQHNLTTVLGQRDVLKLRLSMLKSIAEAASQRHNRYGQAEIRNIVTVDVRQIRQQTDHLARQFRELDTKIQTINWLTELA